MNTLNHIHNEKPVPYQAQAFAPANAELDTLLNQALQALLSELQRKSLYPTLEPFTAPEVVKNYLILSLAREEREHFHVLFLDNQHRLLLDVRLFSGTVDGASVYPREVVKQALHCNANAVILAHNHPSGLCQPSQADRDMTGKLKQGLALMDIRVLDHVIVGHLDTYSFAEHGAL